MSFIEKYFDKEFEHLSYRELINAPVYAISGITKEDAGMLDKALGIKTVHDLANNKYVNIAQAITIFADYSDEILDKAYESEKFRSLADQPVDAIAGISKNDAELLKKSLQIETIRDLAENKFVAIAQITVSFAFLEELMEETQQ